MVQPLAIYTVHGNGRMRQLIVNRHFDFQKVIKHFKVHHIHIGLSDQLEKLSSVYNIGLYMTTYLKVAD